MPKKEREMRPGAVGLGEFNDITNGLREPEALVLEKGIN